MGLCIRCPVSGQQGSCGTNLARGRPDVIPGIGSGLSGVPDHIQGPTEEWSCLQREGGREPSWVRGQDVCGECSGEVGKKGDASVLTPMPSIPGFPTFPPSQWKLILPPNHGSGP